MSQWKPKDVKRNSTPKTVQLLEETNVERDCVENCGNVTTKIFMIKQIPLCEKCYQDLKWTKYKTLSRKQATEQFNISSEALHHIPSVKVPHPTRSDWTLRLFLKTDVETLQPQTPQPRENVTTIKMFTYQPLSDDMKRTLEMQIRSLINSDFSDYLRVDSISYGDG